MNLQTNELILSAPEGQRYSCLRCGWCCRWWRVEVTPSERDRLLAHNWGAENPRLAGARLFDERTQAGRFHPVIQTAHDLGQCVFLDDDDLCIIHKTLGEDAKPATCRRFPLVIGYGADGPMVGADYSCLAMVRNEGRPLPEVVAERSDWLLTQARGHHWESQLRVSLVEGVEAEWAAYLVLEETILGILGRRDTPVTDRLRAGGRLLSSVVEGLTQGALLTQEEMRSCLDAAIDGVSSAPDANVARPADRLLSPSELAPLIGDVEVPHTRTSGRGSRAIGYSIAVSSGTGRVYSSILRQWVDLSSASVAGSDLYSPEADELLTRFLCNYVLRKALLKCATVAEGWSYLWTCLSLVRWYADAVTAGAETAGAGASWELSIQVVEKAFVP